MTSPPCVPVWAVILSLDPMPMGGQPEGSGVLPPSAAQSTRAPQPHAHTGIIRPVATPSLPLLPDTGIAPCPRLAVVGHGVQGCPLNVPPFVSMWCCRAWLLAREAWASSIVAPHRAGWSMLAGPQAGGRPVFCGRRPLCTWQGAPDSLLTSSLDWASGFLTSHTLGFLRMA